MGSLLSMVLAEQNSFKLTKSICTCQGKNPLFSKSVPRAIPPENFRGRVCLGWNGANMELIAGIFVAN